MAAGVYKVIVSDPSGCIKDSANVTVVNSNGPTATVSVTNVSCFGNSDGEATANPTGSTSYTYSWNTIPVQTTQTATGLAKGTYIVTITDNNNCVIMENAVIGEPDVLQITASATDVTCNGLSNGSASVAAPVGGTPPYTYSWNTVPVQTSQIATGLVKGTYTVTVTDANTCSVSTDITVDEPDPLQFSTGKTDISCNGFNDGSANVASVSGGTPPYSYLWNTSPQQNTPAVTGLLPGTYTILVSDDNGCSETQDVTITEPAAFSVSIDGVQSLCSAESGTISATPNGGASPFSYTWIPDIGTGPGPHAISLLTGLSYHVDVTDAGGCTSSADYAITETECYHFYIPTAFSPNGDGNNDLFQPIGRGITAYNMAVYNRWGERVFETKVFTEGWKGDLKGNSAAKAPAGVYIYLIKANDSEGQIKNFMGTISLTK